MTREAALSIVREHVKDAGLVRHMLAVEAAMRAYAATLRGDPDAWGLAGLLHDFDWEIHPDLERHPRDGAPILRARGVPDDVIRTILAHNEAHTGVKPERPEDHALLACDEITGLIVATALVRPSKSLSDVETGSIKKKWKDKAFAAGVRRDEVERYTAAFAAACFGGALELWPHVGNVLAAMQQAAAELELDGRLAKAVP